MKPDPVQGATKAPKQPKKKATKKSLANSDADWVPELEEVSLTLAKIVVKAMTGCLLTVVSLNFVRLMHC